MIYLPTIPSLPNLINQILISDAMEGVWKDPLSYALIFAKSLERFGAGTRI